jgi:nucleoid DNA-binding protein
VVICLPKGGCVTKKEIAQAIAESVGVTQAQVKAIVEQVFDGIIEVLVTEGRIELRNFGVFEVKRRRPRQARNPRTGAAVAVPARAVVTFKADGKMAYRVRQLKQVPRRPKATPNAEG